MSSQKYEMSSEAKMGSSATRPCLSTRTKFVLLVVVIVLLVGVVIVLAVTMANKDKKYDELKNKGISGETKELNDETSNLCLTHTCLETANRVNEYMDPDAEPCENFYQYACGGWEKKYPIPYYSLSSWSVIEDLDHDSLKFFRDKLEMPASTSSFEPEVKARTIYGTCMKTEDFDEIGLSEVREIVDSMGGLYSNTSLPYPTFDLTERLLELYRLRVNPLFTPGITFHRHRPNTIVLDISPTPGFLVVSQKESTQIFQILGIELLNVWKDLYAADTENVPSNEGFLNTYYVMNDIKETLENDVVQGYAPAWNETLVTITELQLLCPQINWTRIIGTVLSVNDNPIPDKISLSNKHYIVALGVLLSRWEPRALDNYLKFSFVLNSLPYLDYKYRAVEENLFNKLILDRKYWYPEPRWRFCVKQMQTLVPMVLGRWYVTDYMESEDDVIEDVDVMIEQVRSMYVKVLENTDLLDKETREFAIRKMQAMDKQIAFSQDYKNRSIIQEGYEHIVANENSSYFTNMVNTDLKYPYSDYTLVGTLSDKDWGSLWLDNPYVVNGYYASVFNRFTILAGILQGAFYNLENPRFVNYGSMGFVIGHEFTHGFDDTGKTWQPLDDHLQLLDNHSITT